jgi:hypothetical protein
MKQVFHIIGVTRETPARWENVAEQSSTPWRLKAPPEEIQVCLGTGYVCFEDDHWSVTRGDPSTEPRGKEPTAAG